jgi:hypothetical protein
MFLFRMFVYFDRLSTNGLGDFKMEL